MKIYSYIVSIIISFFALIPPVDFVVLNPNRDWWLMMVVIAGFLGFLTIFIKKNIFIKIIAVGGFINCFLSCAPYICFTAYFSLLACCYFYILCTKIKEWDIIYKTVLCLVIYNMFFMTLQFFGKDTLINFGVGRYVGHAGIIGSRMQEESFLLVCLVLLMVIKGIKKNFFENYIMGIILLSVFLILCVYTDPILHNPFASRVPTWLATIRLSNEHPFIGWGIGSYKCVFMPLSGLHTFTWKTAHNDFLQVLFETGYLGLSVIIAILGTLLFLLRKNKTLIIGLILICIDMSIHFPFRVANTVLILITFISYCEYQIRRQSHGLSCK